VVLNYSSAEILNKSKTIYQSIKIRIPNYFHAKRGREKKGMWGQRTDMNKQKFKKISKKSAEISNEQLNPKHVYLQGLLPYFEILHKALIRN
jgi:hypothetical protein